MEVPAGRRSSWVALARPLLAVSALVVLLSVAVTYVAHRLQVADPTSEPIAALRWFDVNSERNVPTVWSATLLLSSSVTAAVLALRGRGAGTASSGWLLVAATCAYLALDETFELHERLGSVGDSMTGERLHFAWVVPGAAVACVVGLVLLQRLRSQPPEVLRRLVAAGGVYLSGALVLEALSGQVLRVHGGGGKAYLVVTAAEEGLEMAGASLLLAALLHSASAREAPPQRPAA